MRDCLEVDVTGDGSAILCLKVLRSRYLGVTRINEQMLDTFTKPGIWITYCPLPLPPRSSTTLCTYVHSTGRQT